MKTADILGIRFDAMELGEAYETLRVFLRGGSNRVVVTPNPEGVMRARRDENFKQALLSADLCLPDGIGIVFASRILGRRVPRKLGGCDTTLGFIDSVKDGGVKIFLLGAAKGVAEAAGKKLEADYTGAIVVGARDGFFTEADESGIVGEINSSGAEILIIGMGMPKQELFAAKHSQALQTRITFCLGGTIDVLAGKKKRPPPFMIRVGLEWLGYLIYEPHRIKRMADLPRFIFATSREAIKNKFGKPNE